MIQAQLNQIRALLRSLGHLVTTILATLRHQPNYPAPNAWRDDPPPF